METFSARPANIIGNVALASLLAGAPLGLLISAVAAMLLRQQYFGFELFKNIALGALAGPFYVFVCGIVFIAPPLFLLRRLGYGGPFFVYAISIAIGLPFLSNGLMAGLSVLALAAAASYAFCRLAYTDA